MSMTMSGGQEEELEDIVLKSLSKHLVQGIGSCTSGTEYGLAADISRLAPKLG